MEKLDERFSLRGSCGIVVRSVVWLRHFVFIVVVNFVNGPALGPLQCTIIIQSHSDTLFQDARY
jgi:hypothetical protein